MSGYSDKIFSQEMDLSILSSDADNELIEYLASFPGKKDVFIDTKLMKLVNRLVPVSKLR